MGDICMSIRDYLAAHAPETPQDWFVPEMPPKPKVGKKVIELGGGNKSWDHDYSDIHAWDIEYKKQLFVQWPYAWADAVLLNRDK